MKNFKIVFLTFLLSIGFLVPSCKKDLVITGCEGAEDHRYFNIKGLSIFNFTKGTNGSFDPITTDSITFSNFKGIFLEYEVEYHAMTPSFSLIGSTMACSYVAGYDGSKTERLTNLSIITLNDFDENHLANSSINDLMNIDNIWTVVDDTWANLGPTNLTEYLANQTGNIPWPTLTLHLNKSPELNKKFQVKIIVELSTGEVYEVESQPIFLL